MICDTDGSRCSRVGIHSQFENRKKNNNENGKKKIRRKKEKKTQTGK